MRKIRVLGIDAGNGVCLFPFKKEPFEIIGNIEPRAVFYDKSNHQWSLNFPNILQARCWKKKQFRDIDVIIGHPDCGHASILRLSRAKENVSAKTNESVNLYFNAIINFKPKFFLMENLPGFLKTYSESDLAGIFPDYHIIVNISSVMVYGNSQKTRERLVIVGIKKTLDKRIGKFFRLPDLSFKAKKADELEITDTEFDYSFGHVREPLDKTCNMILGDKKKITYKEARDKWVGEYKSHSKWPVGGKMKNQPGVNKNLKGQYPFTVRKQNRQFNTKGLVLSPREMARIQGLPDKFKMVIPRGNDIYWLNKWRTTVTKTMPYDIARWFAKKLLSFYTNH